MFRPDKVPRYNNRLMNASIEAVLSDLAMEVDNTFWPSKADFVLLWEGLTNVERRVVASSIANTKMGQVVEELGETPGNVTKILKRKNPGLAVLSARMCHLPSDKARAEYIGGFVKASRSLKYYHDELQKLIVTDREHLKELAGEFSIASGTGKRKILKELVAYGMQVKKVEDEVVCSESGTVTSQRVVALADPKMAFSALQELNRMDHEYGQDDKATSSIESQAERVKRLSAAMNRSADIQAKRVGAVARKVSKRELLDLKGDKVYGV